MKQKLTLVVAVLSAFALSSPLMAQGGGRGRGAAGTTGATGAPAGRAGGAARGGRAGGFPQYTRPLAPQDVLVRGKSLYEAHCASCHASDLRGVLAKNGPNLLHSTVVFSDKQGEGVAASLTQHNPVINLPTDDSHAIAEYLHSIQATMGPQGSPPGRNPVGLTYNVLVGDPKAGEAEFQKLCSNCHSVTGDLKGIGSKYEDPKTLQNTWVSGGGGGRGRGAAGGLQGTVTLANGQKFEGRLIRHDDFLIVLVLADGTRKSFAIENGSPKLEIKDPQEGHKKMLLLMDDPDNKNMHDITAYLATIK
ncbi:MAG TPA: c-type cytochrome [Bryobacteraceae bacterium]|nr:c-type cytochrome [Bryobacteraceae bacterium]